MFSKVLIANRGEIAVRIIRSVHDAGYSSVAVYSAADENAAHVALADEAVLIGPAPASKSYLVIENILKAAGKTGADAIHPGYGFLSENDAFAEACEKAGITFIGPSAEAIRLMGNKRVAKQRMIEAGIPCIPGYQGEAQDDATLLREAEHVGYPLMIKAAAGGGGRGMRMIEDASDVAEAITSARTESLSAFGSDELILERAVVGGRHIEIQIMADAQGNVIYLGERDCSIQRRHQKVIEEAPSPFVDSRLRAAMGKAAVEAAKACDYHGAGTVEFLVDEAGTFFFLEMNTRLQVEHPVTELITGLDLVDLQLQVAAGLALPIDQEAVTLEGHAIEARLYAEDPADGFMPQTGDIHYWAQAQGEGVRTDHCVVAGNQVSPHYDPMLAKVIAYGSTREEARRRLVRALGETSLLGVVTNRSFLSQILADPRFVAGAATTAFIDQETLAVAQAAAIPGPSNLALAAVLCLTRRDIQGAREWRWTNTDPISFRVILEVGGDQTSITLLFNAEVFEVAVGEAVYRIALQKSQANRCDYILDGVRKSARLAFYDTTLYLDARDQTLTLEDVTYAPALSADGEGSGRVIANTEGLVILVAVAEGDRVEKGQTLVTIEAMKMEHRLLADGNGVVREVPAQEGVQVKKGQLMVEVELDVQDEEKL